MQIITDATLRDVFCLCLCIQRYLSADQMVYLCSVESWMIQILKFNVAFPPCPKPVLCKIV